MACKAGWLAVVAYVVRGPFFFFFLTLFFFPFSLNTKYIPGSLSPFRLPVLPS